MDGNINRSGQGLHAFTVGPRNAAYVTEPDQYAARDGNDFEVKIPKGVKNALPRRVKKYEHVIAMIALHGEPSTWIQRSADFTPELNSEDEHEGVSMASFFMKSPPQGSRKSY